MFKHTSCIHLCVDRCSCFRAEEEATLEPGAPLVLPEGVLAMARTSVSHPSFAFLLSKALLFCFVRQSAAPSADKPKREAILDLGKYTNERIRVKFTGGREGPLNSMLPVFRADGTYVMTWLGLCSDRRA